MNITSRFVSFGILGYVLKEQNSKKVADCWIYRDDIGAWWGIKGYEE